MKAILLFPHQLFEDVLPRCAGRHVLLIEHPLYFTQLKFHASRLILHRASMCCFAQRLREAGAIVRYVSINEYSGLNTEARWIYDQGVTDVVCYDVTDDWLEHEIRAAFEGVLGLRFAATPQFLTPIASLEAYFADRTRYRMAAFYQEQRTRMGILVDADGKPTGGRWSFDEDNRRRLPRSIAVPQPLMPATNQTVLDARRWVETHFPNAPGLGGEFTYQVTHAGARNHLHHFLANRFELFGPYEDAMAADDGLLFHSCLTPALNTGLITPQEVVDAALSAADEANVSLNSVEGFIRQVIGWREFIRGVYVYAGRQQRTRNTFGFTRKMPRAFWNAQTGLPPADVVISRLLNSGYCHHIERLMVLGCLMLLCEIHPDEVYRWFMTLFVDANDWVMVPNVYGMSQFADGGLMSTKPYICGSAYLRKMGDWETGPWTDIWDGLYWRFIDRHRDVFRTNQRFGVAPAMFDKMDIQRRTHLMNAAEQFLDGLV